MNIVFRKSLLEQLGGFDPNFGMTKNKLVYGDETKLLLRTRNETPHEIIYYDPRLYVYHLVRPEKMTMRWIIRQRFAMGRDTYRTFQGNTLRRIRRGQLIREAIAISGEFFIDLMWRTLRRNRSRYPYIQNYLFERAFNHLRVLGRLYEQYQEQPPITSSIARRLRRQMRRTRT